MSRFDDDNVLSAFCASQITLNATRRGFDDDPYHSTRILNEGTNSAALANLAAKFVRENPEAPVEAVAIHVHMAKHGRQSGPDLNHRERAAWTVFRATLVALDEAEKARAAEEAAAQAKPEPSGGWPGERALQPQKPAFSPSGFSPR